jgi:phosphoribosylglycinamide formyltransferase-1
MSIVVLISGSGTNLQAILDAGIPVSHVISNTSEAQGLRRAENARIPWSSYKATHILEKEITAICEAKDIKLIVLAGFMRILGEQFIYRWRNKIVNVHPSLLPAFKGAHAIKRAWEYGVKVTGVTIHYVNEQIDEGEIIAQKTVNVTKKDTLETLERKIHKIEHKLYPTIIKKLLNDQNTT